MILQLIELGCLDNSTDERTVNNFVNSIGSDLESTADNS